MATSLDIPQFGTGASPGINATRMQAIWTFLKALASGGSGSVVNSDKVAGTVPGAGGLAALAKSGTIWAADNDGAESGLNADLLDGVHLAGLTRPRDNGLIGYWNMNNLPEYPDGTATYLQGTLSTDAWTGWATMGADTVVSVASGNLVLTKGAAPTTFVRANYALDISSKSVRVKWSSAQTDLTTVEIGTSGTGAHVTKSIAGLTSGIVDILVGTNFTDIELIFNSTGANANPVTVDFIHIGDPAVPYATKLMDNSGNGNHMTLSGAIPVEGASGRGLRFDGVNDVAYSTTISMTGYTAMTVDFWCAADNINNNRVPLLFGAYNVSGIYIQGASSAGGNANLIINRAGANQSVTLAGFFSATLAHYSVKIDNTAMTYVVEKNGAVLASGALTAAMVMPNTTFYIGTYGTNWFAGVFDEVRLYSRATTFDESVALYLNPDGVDCTVDASTPVPYSRARRDENGNIGANGIKFPSTQAASSDPNVLDGYKEIPWTPGISFGGGTTGITYTTQVGTSTKIGNCIIFQGHINISNKGSSTGIALVTGLPLASSAATGAFNAVSLRPSSITFADMMTGYIGTSATTIKLEESTNAGVVTSLTDADFANGSTLVVSGHYFV